MTKKHNHYAGFWVRFSAGIIDVLFMIPPFFIFLFLIGIKPSELMMIGKSMENYAMFVDSPLGHVANYVSYGLGIFYIIYFTTRKKQATIGKRIMKIHIANIDGSKLSTPKVIIRAFVSMITTATLGLGFIPVAFTKEKISFHDFVCKTRVFYDKK